MNIKIVKDTITLEEVRAIAEEYYGDMIKGVVDLNQEVIALGGEYHMDANTVLIEQGSLQHDVWGFNIYLNKSKDEWLEYTSLINIRPLDNNRSMFVESAEIRDIMKRIINAKII